MTTLPPVIPPMSPTPSGLLVPTPPVTEDIPLETSPSGLVVVRNRLSPVAIGAQLVVPTSPIAGDGALDAAKAAHAELAATSGAPAADILVGPQLEIAQRVRNDEIRQQAIAAFLAGDLDTAAALMSRAG